VRVRRGVVGGLEHGRQSEACENGFPFVARGGSEGELALACCWRLREDGSPGSSSVASLQVGPSALALVDSSAGRAHERFPARGGSVSFASSGGHVFVWQGGCTAEGGDAGM
jgi:hypothetical protein